MEYENLIVNGRFQHDRGGDIETIIVPPNTTIKRGSLLGGTSEDNPSKYGLSENVNFETTGSAQSEDIVAGMVVEYKVASGGAGDGTLGFRYKALTSQTGLDLDTVNFDADTANWLPLGSIVGTEVPKAICAVDAVNKTDAVLEVKTPVYKTGSYNSLGVIFGNGKTVQNTKDDLNIQSIEIIKGEA